MEIITRSSMSENPEDDCLGLNKIPTLCEQNVTSVGILHAYGRAVNAVRVVSVQRIFDSD
jgi:hypothetical protein